MPEIYKTHIQLLITFLGNFFGFSRKKVYFCFTFGFYPHLSFMDKMKRECRAIRQQFPLL